MRKSIIAAAILVGTPLAASAGTELQLQFKRWAYEGNGAVDAHGRDEEQSRSPP